VAWKETIGSVAAAFGWWRPAQQAVGCRLGREVYRETKRAATIANVHRRPQTPGPRLRALITELFPELDVGALRYRTGCRLPPNHFREDGWVLAMTFGSSIFWRGEFDEDDPRDVVNFLHEVMHADQVRRYGGESGFACEYGKGYVEGGGRLPAHITEPTRYHRNPLEAEAYSFEARFQDGRGRVIPGSIPWPA
jgi:hypothetical protein